MREKERERGFDWQNVYTTDTRRESTEHLWGIWILFVVVCDETKQKKKKFFSSKEEAISAPLFFYSFSLAWMCSNLQKSMLGGWKQYTRDAYIKDLKPIKEAMIYVTATTVVVVCWSMKHERETGGQNSNLCAENGAGVFFFLWTKWHVSPSIHKVRRV